MEAKTKMTQRDIILWHLQNVGTLTRAQAMGETVLSSYLRVSLSLRGLDITSQARMEHLPIALARFILIFINWRIKKWKKRNMNREE